jgi:hypothetical protein
VCECTGRAYGVCVNACGGPRELHFCLDSSCRGPTQPNRRSNDAADPDPLLRACKMRVSAASRAPILSVFIPPAQHSPTADAASGLSPPRTRPIEAAIGDSVACVFRM